MDGWTIEEEAKHIRRHAMRGDEWETLPKRERAKYIDLARRFYEPGYDPKPQTPSIFTRLLNLFNWRR